VTATPIATATATRTATATASSVATATPSRTPAPPASNSRTLTFDDLANANRPLNSQYPGGLIDWGTNAWFLSGPFGRFTTQSVAFNGSGPTSASFTVLAAQRLDQLDAYNGGATPSTVSLSCAGQPSRTWTVAANQLVSLPTTWSGTCSTVTVSSSNGWDTNFDNLVLSASGGANPATSTPTSTPTSTRTATSTATRTPNSTVSLTPAATQTLAFDDLANPNRPLNGQYPSGVVDWGTNVWYLAGPWAGFTTQSISFNGPRLTSGILGFSPPRRLVRLDAYNGAISASTVTLSCAGQPSVSFVVGGNQLQTVSTGWTAPCNSVTIGSSNGWDTNFDNVVIL
jgi:hypothetical protein